MQCYTELTSPTAATHSLSLPFLSASANNLVVAKTSLLQIFSFKSVLSDTNPALDSPLETRRPSTTVPGTSTTPSAGQKGDRLYTTKLVLIAQYELSGTITSLARLRILGSKSGGEALLVSLRSAKLSLVEWDPQRYSISTISIHLYEREDVQGSPWDADSLDHVNYLSVDPRSRCAALKFGARHLAILPFYQAGDDLVMDDYDPEIDGERSEPSSPILKTRYEKVNLEKTPYAASFVVSLLALDPSLSHPLHLAFLYEYREPTFGILSSQVASSSALLHERRDCLSYTVITLDLEQRASTALLTVTNLPYDLFAVIPLRLPIGGTFLVGANEVIYVDQSGKTNGVAVNEFAKISTSFAMTDQSDLGLRLEGSVVEQLGLDNSELLIITSTGELAIVGFKIDGRSVSGVSIRRCVEENGGHLMLTGPSCASIVGRGRIFIGSEQADSIVLGWSRKADKLKRQRSRTDVTIDDESDASEFDGEDMDDDEDDLYSGVKAQEEPKEAISGTVTADNSNDYRFRVHDKLEGFGPMRNITLGKISESANEFADSASEQELLVSTGCGRAGGVATFTQKIRPEIKQQYSIPEAQKIWTVRVQNLSDMQLNGPDVDEVDEVDKYIIASRNTSESDAQSAVYKVGSGRLEELTDTDFDPEAGATVEVGTLNNGTRIVQVLSNEVRTFDAEFGLAQIVPMTDEATGAEPKALRASFADPYVLLIRDDTRILLLRAEESGDLDEIELGPSLQKKEVRSGTLFEDTNDNFRLEFEDSDDEAGNVLMFLLTEGGGLQVCQAFYGKSRLVWSNFNQAQIFRLPRVQKPVYVAEGLSFLPPFLAPDFTVRRSQAREILTEILVAELGDPVQKSPFMILRSEADDLTIYQPYQAPIEGSLDTTLQFLKSSNPHCSQKSFEFETDGLDELIYRPLQVLHELGDYSAVFLPGDFPTFILKSASSPPQLVPLEGSPINSLGPFHTHSCEKGFAFLDQKAGSLEIGFASANSEQGHVNVAQLPQDSRFETGWVTRKIPLGEEVQALDCHPPSQTYVIGTSSKTDFKLPEDENHPDWGLETTLFLPRVEQGTIKVLDRETWSIIDEYPLDPYEIVTCIKSLSLEKSEHTHSRADLIAVGTAFLLGSDLPSAGGVYVFDIIPCVPNPDFPQTSRRLKMIAKEDTKGAVTALSSVGTQGFLLTAQGQKCMVRGLKEDNTLLPVAFIDMHCYTTVAKELGPPATGLCLLGDAIKGVSLAGYYEEPYQLRLFGKSDPHIEVLAADFLPDAKALYLVVADADSNVHVLQFDPENPKSLSGQRLLHLTSFHTGHFATSVTLLPVNGSDTGAQMQNRSLLLTSTTGSLRFVKALDPMTHRTLAALQSHLQTTLPHPLGLNPRAYRAATAGVDDGMAGLRGGILDGMILRRWLEPGRWRRWGDGEWEEVRKALTYIGKVEGLL
ncbi:MAG: hypothetical protein Q9214_000876 [Letrouitia sp. 1 TL-2023]